MNIPQDSMSHRPSPALEYSNRIPSAPIIQLPIPMLEQSYRSRGIDLGAIYQDPTKNGDQTFLTEIQPQRIHGLPVGSWKYEHRRDIQPILPFLYLGPFSALRNMDYLKEQKITMLLGVQPPVPSSYLTAPARHASSELGIPLELITADKAFELTSQYSNVACAINQHLAMVKQKAAEDPSLGIEHGKILMFCDSGNQKSATLAAAYIMETFENVDHLKAMQVLMSTRFCCDFEEGYRQSLKNFNDVIRARRQVHSQLVASSGFTTADSPPMKHKRGHDNDNDEDGMIWEADGDGERFEGRSFKPFAD